MLAADNASPMTSPVPSSAPHRATPDSPLLARWFAAVRRSGLWSSLSAEDWQTLSALFSFVDAGGQCRFRLDHLAFALGIPGDAASARLQSLAQARWTGTPVITVDGSPDGEVVAALAPLDLLQDFAAPEEVADPAVPSPDGGRNAPAPLVPAIPTLSVGFDAPAAEGLRAELEAAGLYPEQIARLLAEFTVERIRRQLAWLPARPARNPAALLMKAIEGDWGPPKERAV